MAVDTGIGSTLRDARNRRKVELSEAESATKIRMRYLRAMENEQWDVLPGGAYSRAFIRTYASYLGLDGERLADDYRRQAEPGQAERAPRVQATGSVEQSRSSRRGLGIALALGVLLVGLLVGIGLAGDGEDTPAPEPSAPNAQSGQTQQGLQEAEARAITVMLAAEAEVWTCLVNGGGEELVDGEIMLPGEERGPFNASSFMAAFGNGEVKIMVDGEAAYLPPSSSPVGYRIEPGEGLSELPEGERPSCE